MKKAMILAGLVILAGCVESHDGATRFSLLTDPVAFTSQATSDRAFDEAMARYGMQRAKTSDVKAFAQRVLTDTMANDAKLAQLAKQNDVTFPATLTMTQQARLAALGRVAHDDFDRIYMDSMVDQTRATTSLMTTASRAANPGVAQFAQNWLPLARDHQTQAERVDVLVGGGLGPVTGK